MPSSTDLSSAFDEQLARDVAFACRERPGTIYDLHQRLGRSEGGVDRAVKRLDGLGILIGMRAPRARGVVWAFEEQHFGLLLDADRRASVGRLREGLRLLIVPTPGLRLVWEKLRSGSLTPYLSWAAEYDAAGPGLVLAVDERFDSGAGARVLLELQAAGVHCETILVRSAWERATLAERSLYFLEPESPNRAALPG